MREIKMEERACPICGEGKLRQETSDFRAEFKDASSGRMSEVVVHNIPKSVCDKCGDFILDEESEDKISAAQRAAMGLVSAQELQAFRKSLGKTQEEMSELLGLGKKTWCRWESNDYFQNESLDRYLRLLMFVPSNVKALETLEFWKHGVAQEVLAAAFPHIRDVQRAKESGRQFEELLRSGPFRSVSR
jgi:putative zinc finger/helix-turn-helix YgiT family protein